MSLRAVILGCGSSGGVPRISQEWGACDPSNPKNRRRRCSIMVQRDGSDGPTLVLVDASPDLREQWLATGYDRIDGILLTHSHADHTHGIDDIRPLVIKARKRAEIYMDEPTAKAMRQRFEYIFATPEGSQYPPLANAHDIIHGQTCRVDGPAGAVEAMPFLLHHGDMDALGFRFGDLAYTPDVVDIPAQSLDYLSGLDTWIIDALRYRKHPSHFSLEEALHWIDKMKPRRAILTNLHTDMDFETLRADLPDGVEPAFDGMAIDITG